MAIADLNHNSPSNQSSQNENIVVNSSSPSDKAVSYPNSEEQVDKVDNPYIGLPSTRDIETAMKKTEDIAETVDDKENTIKALTLIIEILQSNPLIVNKFVIAELETLTELIKLLTSADNVEIDCNDIECSCTKVKYQTVKRIYITKDKEVYSIHQCPVILRLFDNYKISLNFVI